MQALPTVKDKIERHSRLGVAYFGIAIFFLLNVVFLGFPYMQGIETPLLLMVIYYWSVYRPTLIPIWFVFCLGLLFDLLSALPLGLTAFGFVLVNIVVTDQRMFLMGQPYITLWFGFFLVTLAQSFMQWAIFGLLHFQWSNIDTILASSILGSLFFPIGSLFLHMIHKVLPGSGPGFQNTVSA